MYVFYSVNRYTTRALSARNTEEQVHAHAATLQKSTANPCALHRDALFAQAVGKFPHPLFHAQSAMLTRWQRLQAAKNITAERLAGRCGNSHNARASGA